MNFIEPAYLWAALLVDRPAVHLSTVRQVACEVHRKVPDVWFILDKDAILRACRYWPEWFADVGEWIVRQQRWNRRMAWERFALSDAYWNDIREAIQDAEKNLREVEDPQQVRMLKQGVQEKLQRDITSIREGMRLLVQHMDAVEEAWQIVRPREGEKGL